MLRQEEKSTVNKPDLHALLTENPQSFFQLDYESFIKVIQKVIPESLYLKGKANVSAEGIVSNGPAKNFYGLTEDEEIRAFSGLLRFKDVVNGTEADYNNFVACQIEAKKPVLTRESFEKMQKYVRETLSTPEDYAAAIWSILCNDLGKVHSVIEAYEQLPNKKNIGHDLLLAELLKEKPDLFPGFMDLTQEHRQQIISGYASGCDVSSLEQLELPIVAVDALKKLDSKALNLYILHTIFDVAGAAAHFKPNGSLTMHEETWAFFNATREALEKLSHQQDNSIEDVYNHYLQFRGTCIGIDNTSPEATALIRIAGLSRLATQEQGQMLLTVWKHLPHHTKEVLTDELNVHGGQGLRAVFVGYGVAMLLNPQSALQKELSDEAKKLDLPVSPEQRMAATTEGLKIGLINLANAFKTGRAFIDNDSKSGYFVIECDKLARFLSKDPKKSLDLDFEVESISDRRADIVLVNRLSYQSIFSKKFVPEETKATITMVNKP